MSIAISVIWFVAMIVATVLQLVPIPILFVAVVLWFLWTGAAIKEHQPDFRWFD